MFDQVLKNLLCAAHNALVLKAESMVDKNEWINKLKKVIQARGGQVGGASMRQSLSEGSLVSHTGKHPTCSVNFSYLSPFKSCQLSDLNPVSIS